MNTSSRGKRRWTLGLVAALAVLAAPLAMADPLGFSLGLFGPGYGVSYSGCGGRWCDGRGFVSAYVGSGWGDDDESAYYAPAYYAPAYYAPAPVYYSRVIYRRPVERVYYSEGDWRGRYWGDREGGDRGWREREGDGWRAREGWHRDGEGGWRREGDGGWRRGDRHGGWRGGDRGHGDWRGHHDGGH